MTQLTQHLTKTLYRLYVYKPAPTSDLFKFMHNVNQQEIGYTSQGFDPVDLDIISSKVLTELKATKDKLNRLPYDAFITRKLPLNINVVSGAITKTKKLTTNQLDFYKLEDIDSSNLLNWKNLYNLPKYKKNFETFSKIKRNKLKTILNKFSIKDMLSYDLTDLLVSYIHTTAVDDYDNSISINLLSDPRVLRSSVSTKAPFASADLNKSNFLTGTTGVIKDSADGAVPLLEENDIVELRIKYLNNDVYLPAGEGSFKDDDGFYRVFIGYISQITKNLMYGNQENLTLTCHGISKMMSLYTTQFVPSIGVTGNKIFEDGIELSDTKFSIWLNKFNAKSAKDILASFLSTALLVDSINNINNQKDTIQTALKNITAKLTNKANLTDKQVKQARADKLAAKKELDILTNNLNAITEYPNPTESNIFKPLNLNKTVGPSDSLDLDLFYPLTTITDSSFSFQSINQIPAVLHMAKRRAIEDSAAKNQHISQIVAAIEAGYNPAFKALLQSAFTLFYSALQKPTAIMSTLRKTTFLETFEDRPGVIRLRPPKYNILNLNKDIGDFPFADKARKSYSLHDKYEIAKDYVIDPNDILDITITRNDPQILTRVDTKWAIPLGGEALQGYTGHYTDPAYLLKYGLRTSGPLDNPLALSQQLGAYLSALQLAVANKDVRHITLTVKDNNIYNVGKLYYIPITNVLAESDDDKVVSRGIVGYITKLTTKHSEGKVPTHALELAYIRIADILQLKIKNVETTRYLYYANFKKLPDLQTYMRLMATNKAVATDTNTAAKHTRFRDAVAAGPITSDAYKGNIILQNGVGKHDINSSERYANTLYGLGLIDKKGLNNNIFNTNVENEKNTFITRYEASSFKNVFTNSSSISKNFLAKLVVLDLDPLEKAYNDHTKLWSFGSFDLTYLMRTIFIIVQQFLHDYTSSTVAPLQGLEGIDITTKLTTSNKDEKLIDNSPEYIDFIDNKDLINDYTFIYLWSTGIHVYSGNSYHTLICVIKAKRSGVVISKILHFYVPHNKLLLLSNLINTGSVRKNLIAKDNQVWDIFDSGYGVMFSPLELSLWSLSDIFENCSEYNLGSLGEDSTDEYTNDLSISYQHMLASFYDYATAMGLSPIYNGISLLQAETDFNYSEFRDSFIGGIKEAAVDFLFASGVGFNEAILIPKAKFKLIKDYVNKTKIQKYVFVPPKLSYLTDYVNNLAKINQVFKIHNRSNLPINQNLSTGFTLATEPAFTVYMTSLKKTTNPDIYYADDASSSDYAPVVRNLFNNAVTRISLAAAVKLNIHNLTNSMLIGMTREDIMKNLRVIILLDNSYFIYPTKFKNGKINIYNKPIWDTINRHPLAYFWHLSYETNDKSYQLKYSPSNFSSTKSKGKLNLYPTGVL